MGYTAPLVTSLYTQFLMGYTAALVIPTWGCAMPVLYGVKYIDPVPPMLVAAAVNDEVNDEESEQDEDESSDESDAAQWGGQGKGNRGVVAAKESSNRGVAVAKESTQTHAVALG